MTADNLAKRAIASVDKAFDKGVTKAARTEWFKVSGKMTTMEQARSAFAAALCELIEIREHQLAVVAEVFKEGA